MRIKKLVLSFILVLCLGLLSACKSYSVAHINENLKNDGFTSYSYTRTISSGEILLLEEKTNATLDGSDYKLQTTLKQLAGLDSDVDYIEETSESTASASDLAIELKLEEEDFEKGHIKVSKTTLTGALEDSKIEKVLGISSAKDVDISVALTNDLKVANIRIQYTDTTTNFTVNISIYYTY